MKDTKTIGYVSFLVCPYSKECNNEKCCYRQEEFRDDEIIPDLEVIRGLGRLEIECFGFQLTTEGK